MSDIRIPDWQSRGRGFVSLILQGNTAHPHATSKVWDRRNHKQYTYGFDHNGNPTTTHEQYAPPLQGQPNPSGPIDLIQENYWDEQNQLRGLWNLSGLHHYIYDADGQRLMKSSVPMSYSSVNAQQLQATNSIAAQDYTVYVSAGLVYESNRGSTTYTKHYYAGPLRVASQIGSGNPNQVTHPKTGNLTQGGPAGSTGSSNGLAVLGDLNGLLAHYGMAVSPTGLPTDTMDMQMVYHPTECDEFYAADLIERDRCLCDHFPDYALSKGIDCSPYTPIYWYHPDYIGNIEFVTDRTGQPYQHFYYAAFGDPLVSQHVGTGSFNSAFRFNAKEYDEETGNYYYGARYYQPKSSIWMGVDALATSYPGMNPYNFTMGNPIMAIDPDGDTTVYALSGTDEVVIHNSPGELSYETVSKEDWSRIYNSVTISNYFLNEYEETPLLNQLNSIGRFAEFNIGGPVYASADFGVIELHVPGTGNYHGLPPLVFDRFTYRTENTGVRTELVNIGGTFGNIYYSGNPMDILLNPSTINGTGVTYEGGLSGGLIDGGLSLSVSPVINKDPVTGLILNVESLYFIGLNASVGVATPVVSLGRTTSNTYINN